MLLAAAVLQGCGPDVHSSAVRGMGYVRLDEVVKHHPLYPQLSQLDDAIAAINLESSGPRVPLTAVQMQQQVKTLNQNLLDAQTRANKIIAEKEGRYAKLEAQAVGAALTAAGVSGGGQYAAAQTNATSAQQAQAAAQAANQDFMSYQQSVISQDNAAAQGIARQLQTQAAQKFRAKAEELQQNETDLSLRLTQQDATQRLSIKTRLSNLAMDDATRTQLQQQLADINAKETRAATAMRDADQATLSAYQAQLNKETSAAVQAQTGSIGAQTRAKIEQRQNEVSQQIRGLGPPPLPANLPAGVQQKIAAIHKQYQVQFQADAQKTVDDYQSTKADLDKQFAALHGADVGATGAAAKELDALQKRRADLYKQIGDQIKRETNRIAKDQGFSTVFVDITAAAGGYDMTNELIKDVEGLHE
jgi:hypothetical protein